MEHFISPAATWVLFADSIRFLKVIIAARLSKHPAGNLS